MFALMAPKTHSESVRIPIAIWERLQRIKEEQAHKQVPTSRFLQEAIRLYVELADSFGIDENLMIKEKIGSYKPAPAEPARASPRKAKRAAGA